MRTFSANVAFDTATYERTNRYKTRHVIKTYPNVTYEDLFWNALILAKVEFGNDESEKEVTQQGWIWRGFFKIYVDDEKKEWRALVYAFIVFFSEPQVSYTLYVFTFWSILLDASCVWLALCTSFLFLVIYINIKYIKKNTSYSSLLRHFLPAFVISNLYLCEKNPISFKNTLVSLSDL